MQKYFTPQGLDKLKEELEKLKENRKVLAEKIAEAKELGDLSENAEYHAAKEEQGMNESRIIEIENILKQAIVVEKDKKSDQVQVGSKVVLKNDKGVETEFEIVGSNEVDPANGKISNESPFGQAMLGKKIGDTVNISTPRGEVVYTILKIS